MREALPPLALLAGGLATRMRPLTESVPKSLLRVDGEPFLAHQLRLLAAQGISDIVICCGHLGEQIEAFAGNGSRFGCCIRYSYDGNTLLGTGGALRHALPLLDDCFFVMYGDSYLLANPRCTWKAFLASGHPAMMTVFRNDGQWEPSNVEVREDRVVRYDKHRRSPEMRYIDYGLSVMQSGVLDGWPDCECFDLTAVMTGLADRGKLAAHKVHGRFYEIGSPEGFDATERMLRALRKAKASELRAVVGCEQ